MTLEPRIVLRRVAAGFFGKILKLNPIVNLANPPRFPQLRMPRWVAVIGMSASGWARLGMCIVGLQLLGMAGAAGQGTALPSGGPTESVYRRNTAALPAATPASPALSSATPAAPAQAIPPPGLAIQGGPGQVTAAGDQATQSERIVSATLSALGRAGSISARVRQRVRVGDRVLVGAGRYVQSGLGEDQRYRLEVTMQSDTETFEVLEICDGLFAWSYRRIGAQPAQLERIDVRRVRDRIQQVQPTENPTVAPYLGGVQRTLALVRDWFRFVGVEPSAIDDLPVWKVEGRWHPESLATLLPAQAEAATGPGGIPPAELPDGMPWSVRLSIGKRDLFPFRIEWLAIPGRRPVADREPEPIAVLELYEVRLDEPVDAAAFVYKPATEGLIDLTESHVQRLQPLRP
jgi:hypothetical protein